MQGIYLLVTLIAVIWLIYWVIMNERSPRGRDVRGPFAIREDDDYRKRYGDRKPF